MSTTLITSRDPQGRQAVSLFEVAYDGATLIGESAQRLNERGGEFQDGIKRLIAELTTSNQYVDEEVGDPPLVELAEFVFEAHDATAHAARSSYQVTYSS